MLRHQGFTLIELVIVIIILSILSAVAVPTYVSLKRETRIATLEGIKGALSSTSLLVEVRAKIDGVENGSVNIEGNNVAVNNTYITGHWNQAWKFALNIGQTIDYTRTADTCTKNDICGVGNQVNHSGLPDGIVVDDKPNGLVLLWLKDDKLEDLCYAFYYNPSNGDVPSVGIVDDGC